MSKTLFGYINFKFKGFIFLFNENNLFSDLVVDIGISKLSLGDLLL